MPRQHRGLTLGGDAGDLLDDGIGAAEGLDSGQARGLQAGQLAVQLCPSCRDFAFLGLPFGRGISKRRKLFLHRLDAVGIGALRIVKLTAPVGHLGARAVQLLVAGLRIIGQRLGLTGRAFPPCIVGAAVLLRPDRRGEKGQHRQDDGQKSAGHKDQSSKTSGTSGAARFSQSGTGSDLARRKFGLNSFV